MLPDHGRRLVFESDDDRLCGGIRPSQRQATRLAFTIFSGKRGIRQDRPSDGGHRLRDTAAPRYAIRLQGACEGVSANPHRRVDAAAHVGRALRHNQSPSSCPANRAKRVVALSGILRPQRPNGQRATPPATMSAAMVSDPSAPVYFPPEDLANIVEAIKWYSRPLRPNGRSRVQVPPSSLPPSA